MRKHVPEPEYAPEHTPGETRNLPASKERQEWVPVLIAAARLGITPRGVRKLIEKGVLPGFQVFPGAPWVVPVNELTRLIREGRPKRGRPGKEKS